MKPAWLALAMAAAALALTPFHPWAAAVAVACMFAVVALEHISTRAAVRESRIVDLETALEKLKATAEALIKVERRTTALEHTFSAVLRRDEAS